MRVILCDPVVGECFVPVRVQCLVNGFSTKLVGLEMETGTLKLLFYHYGNQSKLFCNYHDYYRL